LSARNISPLSGRHWFDDHHAYDQASRAAKQAIDVLGPSGVASTAGAHAGDFKRIFAFLSEGTIVGFNKASEFGRTYQGLLNRLRKWSKSTVLVVPASTGGPIHER
jgi:hypothetical protein